MRRDKIHLGDTDQRLDVRIADLKDQPIYQLRGEIRTLRRHDDDRLIDIGNGRAPQRIAARQDPLNAALAFKALYHYSITDNGGAAFAQLAHRDTDHLFPAVHAHEILIGNDADNVSCFHINSNTA